MHHGSRFPATGWLHRSNMLPLAHSLSRVGQDLSCRAVSQRNYSTGTIVNGSLVLRAAAALFIGHRCPPVGRGFLFVTAHEVTLLPRVEGPSVYNKVPRPVPVEAHGLTYRYLVSGDIPTLALPSCTTGNLSGSMEVWLQPAWLQS